MSPLPFPAYETWERLWMRFVWRPMERLTGAVGAGIQSLFSRDGFSLGGHILLLLGLTSSWLQAPVQGKVGALRIPLFSSVDLADPGRRWLSAGGVLTLVLAAAWLTKPRPRRAARRGGTGAWVRRPFWFATAAGTLALLVTCSFLLQLAFLRPEMLRDIMGELRELQNMKLFDTYFIQGNIGSIRVPWLQDATLLGQLSAAVDRTGMGFWFTAAGGVLLLAHGFREIRRRNEAWRPLLVRCHAAFGLLPVVLLAALSVPALVADSFRELAHERAAAGGYHRARELYRRAASLDARLAINDTFLARMGAALYHSGDREAPEARYYLAQYHRDRREFQEGERQLREAMKSLEAARREAELRAFRRKLADLLVDEGAFLLHAGQPYAAEARWREARELWPSSLEVPYYLARVHYQMDGPHQEAAIALNEELLQRVRDRILRSDLYCNLGEAYARAGDFARAREMYEESLDVYNYVKDINFRAMRGMIGL